MLLPDFKMGLALCLVTSELVLAVEVVNDVPDDNELLDVVCPHSHERARVASNAKPLDSFVIICASKAGRLAIRVILRIHKC